MDKKHMRRQYCIRIGALADERLKQVAEMFDMKASTYIKAVIYKDLGIFNEPLDRRKRKHHPKPDLDDWELHESFKD